MTFVSPEHTHTHPLLSLFYIQVKVDLTLIIKEDVVYVCVYIE